jgi:hypothetical protein
MSANRDCRNVYPHFARFEGGVDTNWPFGQSALPHRVWARSDSTLESMKRFTTPYPLWCIRKLLGLCNECHLCCSRRRHPSTRSRPAKLALTRRGDCRVSTEATSSVPSVKRAVIRNPEQLPSVRTLPMHPSLTCEIFRAHTERGTRPDPLSRDRAAEWRS